MNLEGTGWSEGLAMTFLGAVFVVLVVVVYWTLGRMPLQFGLGRLPFAIAFSLLCVLGLGHSRSGQGPATGTPWFDVVLLPYEAFAITILLLPLVFLFAWLWGRRPRSPKEHWGAGDAGKELNCRWNRNRTRPR